MEHEDIEGRLAYRYRPKRMEERFRHDDDAVAVSFVEQFKRAAMECRPFLERNKFVTFDYPKGYVERPNAQGLHAQETFHPFWGRSLGPRSRCTHARAS